MLRSVRVDDFSDWRDAARSLLSEGVPPDDVTFVTGDDLLLPDDGQQVASRQPATFSVPRQFVELSKTVGCHRDRERWDLLYRVLWRVTHGESHLLDDTADADIHRLHIMKKNVRREAHKTKAFVRFKRTVAPDPSTGKPVEHYIAWHRPDHRVLPLVAGFFSRRFNDMRWTILTPVESVSWDLKQLTFGPGVPRSEAPRDDELEDLWKTYYANIFNPARVKLDAMKAEMPVKHWPTMPETELIPELLRGAETRVAKMVSHTEGATVSAAHYLPESTNLAELAKAAASCEGCALHENATQTVFGQGPASAKLVFVGEQPGDQEDLAGQPFIGPAGQLFDRFLSEAGIDRSTTYVTNAVKHFKFEPKGKRRLHKKPGAREIAACKPWLESELTEIKPRVLVCLGATAAQAVFGRTFRITQSRGQWLSSEYCDQTIATYHPSALLRAPTESQRVEMEAAFRADLLQVASKLA